MLDVVSNRDHPVVLLIDDDMVSREVTATLLVMSGYVVHTAESGEAALRMLAAGLCNPGVVLTDAQMPGLSGAKLIGELRAACRRAAVYTISGSQPAEAVTAASDGMLLKPFDATALRKLLEGRGAEHRTVSFLEPDEPAISTEVLGQLRQVMPESAVGEIYLVLVADLKRRIEALGAAIVGHDREQVRRIGHAIKGGCGMAGALQAARLGALLETQALGGEDNYLDNSRALLRDLRAAVLALQRILEDKLPA